MRLLLMLLFFCLPSLVTAHNVAVVVRASGEVLRIDRQNQSTALNRRDTLAEGDLVQTGRGAYATLKFSDQSVVDLGENTGLRITRFNPEGSAGKRKILLELLNGRLRAITGSLAKEPEAFDLRTQHASIGVRGTEFEVFLESKNETRIIRHEGIVLVRSLTYPDETLELDDKKPIASVVAGKRARYLDEVTQPDEVTQSKGTGRISAAILARVNEITAPPLISTPSVPLVLPLGTDGAVPLAQSNGVPMEPVTGFVDAVQNQQWSLARTLANALLDQYEGLPRFDLYYGILLIHEQAFDEAVFAFERVLVFYPEQHRARLELGHAYFLLQNYVRAKDALEQVLSANPPEPIAQSVRALLKRNEAAMHQAQEQTLLGGQILLGWDTNANLGSSVKDGELAPNLLNLTDIAEASKAKASSFLQWSVTTGLIQPTSQNSSHLLQLDFTSKNYFETGINDTASLTGSIRFNTQYDQMRYNVPLSTQFSWQAGKLWQNTTTLGVTPQVRVWGPLWAGVNIATEVNLALNDRNTTSVKDSAGLVFDAQERGRVHTFSSNYLQSQVAGQDDEYLEWQGLANAYQLRWRLPKNLSSLLSVEHQWRHYKADDLFFTVSDASPELKRRQDQVVDALLNTSWVPVGWFQTSLILEWHQVASNINAYSYEQWIVSSAINVRF